MSTITLPPLTDHKILWNYLTNLQPSLQQQLAHFGFEDAHIQVSKIAKSPSCHTDFGHGWVVEEGQHMDGEPVEFIRAAECLADLVAGFRANTSEITSPQPMPAGFGAINKAGWIAVVTGPDADAVCKMISKMVLNAIEGYEAYIAACSPPA